MMLTRPSPLRWALLLSLVVHGLLLGLQVADPTRLERAFRDTPLEVILVNTRSNEPTAEAQALAQAQLAGGGDAGRDRPTSPLPPAPELALGDAAHDERQRVDRLRDQQQELLARSRRELASMPAPAPLPEGAARAEVEQHERQRQLLRQLAEIERRVNEDSAQPRRRYIGPASREVAYAVYYDRLRKRIEERGTRDFPELGGRKLYGELTMNVTVDSAGRVVDAEIVRPSVSKLLDQRALAIVQAAAPFGAFTPAMRLLADQIVITSRFRFTREDGLETSLSNR